MTQSLVPAAKPKKGKKMDPMQSLVSNPKDIPWDEKADPDRRKELAQTIWRPDKLGELTYTQFWRLITERKIEKVCSSLPAVLKPQLCTFILHCQARCS